ncbi:MAG: chemotaxis protein CheB [Marinilabiliales bacterium]
MNLKSTDIEQIDKLILIGGSAGSFRIVLQILQQIKKKSDNVIILCLHRLKTARKGFCETLNSHSKRLVIEPLDKEPIVKGNIYLAPANYHLCVNFDYRFFLSIEETVYHSRPSINLLFSSASMVFKDKVTGVILSGANEDGANGLKQIEQNGGKVIVQNPDDAQIDTMPIAAINNVCSPEIFNSEELVNKMISIC